MTKITRTGRRVTAASLGALMLFTGGAMAQTVLATNDGVIRNSLCVGTDCANTENFGFDTLRLKENNLRIHFNDTSNSGSFPTADWRIVANDSSNGGASYLAFEDSDAGRQTFRVTAGAPANSLFVASSGRVGLKTSTPAVELHLADGDTPTLRLEQNGSSGFAPQTWDIAGNETNFFVRDVTNGSLLSFRIRPGAPANSIFVDNDGKIGLGTAAPTAALHVARTDGSARLLIKDTNSTAALRQLLTMENNGNVFFRMANVAHTDTWDFATESGQNSFAINANGGGAEFRLSNTGNLTISGTLTTTGSCSIGCDAVFTDGYEIPPISVRAAMMYDLGYLPNVGPTAESGEYELTSKVLGMLNELEHAHIYIAQLNDRIEVLEARLAEAD